MSKYKALKKRVSNRGIAPDLFLDELLEFGRTAPEDIFEPNANPKDIYAYIKPVLGPWENLLHRRAALLEEMRVHAGFESSWNWKESVDTTNRTSMTHREGEETGIFQVSFNSTFLGGGAMREFATEHGIGTAGSFIWTMKVNHKLALEYYARLMRVSVQWAGPVKRHEIDRWLSRDAVAEIQTFLTTTEGGEKDASKVTGSESLFVPKIR